MKKLILEPNGWPCTLSDCPPGPFIYKDQLCFKSEYGGEKGPDAYNSAGEYFCGKDRNQTEVQSVIPMWVIDEE